MAEIHPSAIVDPNAELGTDVSIGPFCTVGPKVKLGNGTRLISHAVVSGNTTLGEGCEVHPFASVGGKTQDLKYDGGDPGLLIGDRTVIRESVTVNCATHDGDFTRVGSDCLLMAYSHVGHDCIIGNGVIMANCGTLAGHVVLQDHVIVGGVTAIHQFCTIGKMTILGGCSKVVMDVPPYMMADGNPLAVRGLNRIGMKRKGIDASEQKMLKEAFRIVYRENLSTSQALEKIQADLKVTGIVQDFVSFIQQTERGITK